MRSNIHTYIHTYIHIHTHTYIYMHAHKRMHANLDNYAALGGHGFRDGSFFRMRLNPDKQQIGRFISNFKVNYYKVIIYEPLVYSIYCFLHIFYVLHFGVFVV